MSLFKHNITFIKRATVGTTVVKKIKEYFTDPTNILDTEQSSVLPAMTLSLEGAGTGLVLSSLLAKKFLKNYNEKNNKEIVPDNTDVSYIPVDASIDKYLDPVYL